MREISISYRELCNFHFETDKDWDLVGQFVLKQYPDLSEEQVVKIVREINHRFLGPRLLLGPLYFYFAFSFDRHNFLNFVVFVI